MLPNLQELYLKEGYSERIQDQDYISTGFDFMYPTTKLEIIEYFGHSELVCQLAMSNLCRHVNSLCLELSSCFKSTVTNVISQLKNMPVLETLHLITTTIKLMDLEILYGNLGSIKYLNLDELDLCSGKIPQNITPATLITKLEYTIEDAVDLNTHIQFYKHMYKKYPSAVVTALMLHFEYLTL
jgi:hypothetical protein